MDLWFFKTLARRYHHIKKIARLLNFVNKTEALKNHLKILFQYINMEYKAEWLNQRCLDAFNVIYFS